MAQERALVEWTEIPDAMRGRGREWLPTGECAPRCAAKIFIPLTTVSARRNVSAAVSPAVSRFFLGFDRLVN
jgi:hypothetical protein